MTEKEVLVPEAKILETVEKSLHELRTDEPSSQRDRTLEEPSSANQTEHPLRETLVDRLYNVPFGMDSIVEAVGKSRYSFNCRRTVKVCLQYYIHTYAYIYYGCSHNYSCIHM